MKKTIHIHVHTRDAGEFKESDHPRAKNGQFGSGGASGAAGKKVTGRGVAAGKQAYEKIMAQRTSSKGPPNHKEAYQAFAKSKGMDPQSRMTFEKYARQERLNPEVKKDLEASAKIGSGGGGASKPRSNSSGVEVKHQPSGTEVKHQAPAVKKAGALPAKSTGPEGMTVHNLHASAGGEKVQLHITSAKQAEWAEKNLGVKTSGEGVGSYNLTGAQTAKLKASMSGGQKSGSLTTEPGSKAATAVKSDEYRTAVEAGASYTAVLDRNDRAKIGKLGEGETYDFKDEQGKHWIASKRGDQIQLLGGDSRFGPKDYKLHFPASKLGA